MTRNVYEKTLLAESRTAEFNEAIEIATAEGRVFSSTEGITGLERLRDHESVGIVSVAASEGITDDDRRGWKRLEFCNVVYGVRADNWCSWYFDRDSFSTSDRVVQEVVPFLWAGLATIAKPYWKRLVQRFVRFIEVFLANTWKAFAETLLGKGHPDSMRKGHQGFTTIQTKKAKVPEGFKPTTPWSGSEKKAGVGIYEKTKSGKIYKYKIDEGDGRALNSTKDTGAGYQLDPDAVCLYFHWRDKEGHYSDNDGECYGSFTLWEQTT
jgi:hypothetical protein